MIHPDTICALKPNLEHWVIDPAKTLVLIPDYPSRQASTALMLWLGKRFTNIQPFAKHDVVLMRNTLVRDTVKRTKFEHYVMIDNDMHPCAMTDALFEVRADLVCVQSDVKCKGAWAYPDDFHCGAFRFNREIADRIALPWFRKEYSADGCDQLTCSCSHFRDKVKAAGFTIQRAGWMHHGVT